MVGYLKKIQKVVDEALEAARSAKIEGAINWGDLSCVEVCHCENQDGEISIKIWIEEADPSNYDLHKYVIDFLRVSSKVVIKEEIEISTEW